MSPNSEVVVVALRGPAARAAPQSGLVAKPEGRPHHARAARAGGFVAARGTPPFGGSVRTRPTCRLRLDPEPRNATQLPCRPTIMRRLFMVLVAGC